LEPLVPKLESFGWQVAEVDGHDTDALERELKLRSPKPRVLVAHTVKGKGVSFMENDIAWHYQSPDDAQLKRALAEIDEE
jgi:transketolase